MLKNITPDKWRHFFAGIVMGAVLQGLVWWILPVRFLLATVVVFVIIIVISYGFELFSKITGKGHYDFIDAVASMLGGVIGMGVTVVSHFLLDR